MNDCIHGPGMTKYKDWKYDGDWARNRMDGKGSFHYNGCIYTGPYKTGIRVGVGTFKDSSGNQVK